MQAQVQYTRAHIYILDPKWAKNVYGYICPGGNVLNTYIGTCLFVLATLLSPLCLLYSGFLQDWCAHPDLAWIIH